MKENAKRLWHFRTRRKRSWMGAATVVVVLLYLILAPLVNLRRVGDGATTAAQMDLPGGSGGVAASDPPHDICDNTGRYIPTEVSSHWRYIDETIHNGYPLAKVSGGIYLYPRQASILSYLIREIRVGLGRTMTICETGFGSGHSLALFAEAGGDKAPNGTATSTTGMRIVSFDRFDRPYQLPMWRHWNETFGGGPRRTVERVAGDSCKTVPASLSDEAAAAATADGTRGSKRPEPKYRCDVLHGSSLCSTDNIDLVENSPCGALLTSTAMNELTDGQVYFGKRAQWRKMRDRQCITDIVCFQEDSQDIQRDLVFAKKGSTHVGKFCMAITTGKCRKGGSSSNQEASQNECLSDIHRVVQAMKLQKICPRHQIQAPV